MQKKKKKKPPAVCPAKNRRPETMCLHSCITTIAGDD
jgi:hypothetical protein